MEIRNISVQVAQVARLMQRVLDEAPNDFTGLGLIVYNQLDQLPHLPLHVPTPDVQVATATGEDELTDVLARLSTPRSPWHDGFHFIRLDDWKLTHLAQFVSPPVPDGKGMVPLERGARHMTAALASMVEGIVLTAVLPAQGGILLYGKGRRVRVKEAS